MRVLAMSTQVSLGSHKGIRSKALDNLLLRLPVLVKGLWSHTGTAHTRADQAEPTQGSALLSCQAHI